MEDFSELKKVISAMLKEETKPPQCLMSKSKSEYKLYEMVCNHLLDGLEENSESKWKVMSLLLKNTINEGCDTSFKVLGDLSHRFKDPIPSFDIILPSFINSKKWDYYHYTMLQNFSKYSNFNYETALDVDSHFRSKVLINCSWYKERAKKYEKFRKDERSRCNIFFLYLI